MHRLRAYLSGILDAWVGLLDLTDDPPRLRHQNIADALRGDVEAVASDFRRVTERAKLRN